MASLPREIERQMQIAGAVITLLRWLPVIIGVLAGVSLALGVLNLINRDYGWAVVNLGLGMLGILFISKLIKSHIQE